MSLQPPAVFSLAADVVYVSESEGITLLLYMYIVQSPGGVVGVGVGVLISQGFCPESELS